MLGNALIKEKDLPFTTRIYGSRRNQNDQHASLPVVSRNSRILIGIGLSWKRRFQVEQMSFLLSLLPVILKRKPKAIYLAEYDLYCWLFKLRSLLNLPFNLVLYTGGGSIPGIFNNNKDWVHHVTDELWEKAIKMGLPRQRMLQIPHFIRQDFIYDDFKMEAIRKTAGPNKKIVLVVGAMNTDHKRMDLAAKIVGTTAADVFPVFVGDETEESAAIKGLLKSKFDSAFLMESCSPRQMGTYYAAADIFFSASKYESFGLTYIEAMHHGLPIFCHRHERLENIVGNHATATNMDEIDLAVSQWQEYLFQLNEYNSCCLMEHCCANENYGFEPLKEKYISLMKKAVGITETDLRPRLENKSFCIE